MSAEGSGVSAEVATREQPQDVVAFEGASENIVTFLADLKVAYDIAVMLCATSFVPSSYSGKPKDAAAAIVTGQGLGLGPMESLRSIDIIQGTPAIRAVALRALVVSKGHEIWVEESSPTRAVVAGRRKGSDVIQRSVWDMARAQTMGLHTKDNWRKQPGAMLIARATSECARLVAPDALLGIPYSSEELEDQGGEKSDEKPRRQLRTVATRARAAQESQEADTEPVDAEVVEEFNEPDPTSETGADGTVLGGFPCSRCGTPGTVDDDAAICGDCEAEIENEEQGS